MTRPLERSILVGRRGRAWLVAALVTVAASVVAMFAMPRSTTSVADPVVLPTEPAPPVSSAPCETVPELGVCVRHGAEGAIVAHVLPGSRAESAGIVHGDLLEEVDCREVRDAVDVRSALDASDDNTPNVKVVRDGVAVRYKPIVLD